MATGERATGMPGFRGMSEESVRWASALDSATFPAALWSGADLGFRWANPRFLELLWESQARFDLLGLPMRGFLSDTESAVRFQDAAYTGQAQTEPAYRFVSPSGTVSHWQLTFLPVPARLGDPYDVLVTAIDRTTEVVAVTDDQRRRDDLAQAEGLIQRTILSSLDSEEILQRSLVEATETYGADWGWIALRELDLWVFRNVHGWPAEMVGHAFRDEELSMPRLAAEDRAVVVAASRETADPIAAEVMDRFDIGAFLLVPLFARGEVRGVMGFCWNEAEPLGDVHRQLGEKLSLSLTLALENARAYGSERYIARTLQSAFFAVPRAVPGLEFGHLYHAANSGARVGGDFYDILEPEPGRVGLLIGDCSGHGIGVSALASLVKSAMHVQALHSPSPRRVLAATNDVVMRSALTDGYASAFFGLLDTGSGLLSYCSAGHPEPVLVRQGGRSRTLKEAHVVLGVDSPAEYANSRASLEIGDLLVLYTDGLVEARDPKGRQYGIDRLLRSAERMSDAPASGIPEALFLDVFSFADGIVQDDVAILALRRTEATCAAGQERLALEVA